MKKIFLCATILVLFCAFCFVGCLKNDSKKNDEVSEIDYAKVENDVSVKIKLIESHLKKGYSNFKSSLIKEDNLGLAVVSFLVVMNKKTGDVMLSNFRHRNFFDLREIMDDSPISGGAYYVSCSGGSKGDWGQDCGSFRTCGGIIIDCLKQGGCATICEDAPQSIQQNANEFLNLDEFAAQELKTIKDDDEFAAVEIIYSDM